MSFISHKHTHTHTRTHTTEHRQKAPCTKRKRVPFYWKLNAVAPAQIAAESSDTHSLPFQINWYSRTLSLTSGLLGIASGGPWCNHWSLRTLWTDVAVNNGMLPWCPPLPTMTTIHKRWGAPLTPWAANAGCTTTNGRSEHHLHRIFIVTVSKRSYRAEGLLGFCFICHPWSCYVLHWRCCHFQNVFPDDRDHVMVIWPYCLGRVIHEKDIVQLLSSVNRKPLSTPHRLTP